MMRPFLVLSLLFAMAIPARAADGFVVVAHPGVGATTLSTDACSAIFLKKNRTWANGVPIVPLDQPEASAVRTTFTAAIHRKRLSAVRTYWHQQIFYGREIPPAQKTSDAEVVAFVKATPGAVGYVSANAATSGVTRLEIQ